jgi:hypothetical protein
VNRDGISSRSLHLIEGEISIVEEAFGTRHRSIETTDSDTQSHRNLDCDREVFTNTFGDSHCVGQISVREEQSELVPSDATHEIEGSPTVPQYGSDAGQHVIADDVPVCIVD